MGWRNGKYNATKVQCDGYTFASKLEHKRYLYLKARLTAGEIRNLELQPKFPCRVNGILVCTYIADFRYWDVAERCEKIEDVKGFCPPLFNLKIKLTRALYPEHTFTLVNAR